MLGNFCRRLKTLYDFLDASFSKVSMHRCWIFFMFSLRLLPTLQNASRFIKTHRFQRGGCIGAPRWVETVEVGNGQSKWENKSSEASRYWLVSSTCPCRVPSLFRGRRTWPQAWGIRRPRVPGLEACGSMGKIVLFLVSSSSFYGGGGGGLARAACAAPCRTGSGTARPRRPP